MTSYYARKIDTSYSPSWLSKPFSYQHWVGNGKVLMIDWAPEKRFNAAFMTGRQPFMNWGQMGPKFWAKVTKIKREQCDWTLRPPSEKVQQPFLTCNLSKNQNDVNWILGERKISQMQIFQPKRYYF